MLGLIHVGDVLRRRVFTLGIDEVFVDRGVDLHHLCVLDVGVEGMEQRREVVDGPFLHRPDTRLSDRGIGIEPEVDPEVVGVVDGGIGDVVVDEGALLGDGLLGEVLVARVVVGRERGRRRNVRGLHGVVAVGGEHDVAGVVAPSPDEGLLLPVVGAAQTRAAAILELEESDDLAGSRRSLDEEGHSTTLGDEVAADSLLPRLDDGRGHVLPVDGDDDEIAWRADDVGILRIGRVHLIHGDDVGRTAGDVGHRPDLTLGGKPLLRVRRVESHLWVERAVDRVDHLTSGRQGRPGRVDRIGVDELPVVGVGEFDVVAQGHLAHDEVVEVGVVAVAAPDD